MSYKALNKTLADFGLSEDHAVELLSRVTPPANWEERLYPNWRGQALNIAFRKVSKPKAVILVAQGRAQYCREWIEFSEHMTNEGYNFVTYDPQGQGLSYSLNPHRRHHIDDYWMTEVHDLASVVKIVKQDQDCATLPVICIGHSKGGNTALRYAAEWPTAAQDFQAMAMISPMTGLQIHNPFLRRIQSTAPRFATSFMMGHYFAPTQGLVMLDRYLSHAPKITSDPVSRAVQYYLFAENPETVCHGATWGFVNEALKSCAILKRASVPESIRMPTFWILGEKEQINDNESMIELHKRMPYSELKIYQGAQHQVHMEAPEIKDEMYRDLKRFIKNTLSL